MELKQYDKMSGFIRDAVAAARNLDRDIYYPDAMNWHTRTYPANIPPTKRYCVVCFAGAVLAGHIPPDVFVEHPKALATIAYEEFGFTHLQINLLQALEKIRTGMFYEALGFVRITGPQVNDTQLRALGELEHDYAVGSFQGEPSFDGWPEFDGFLNDMEALADQLAPIYL